MSEEIKVFCTQCGSGNSATAKFCSNCGSKLEAAAPVEEPVQPQTADNVYAQGLPEEETTSTGESFYEKVTEAEEIKPEPIQEEIKINYDSTQYYSSNPTTETVSGGNIGVAIASLICGILSLVCCCLSWFSLVLAIAAIVLGIITIVKKYDGKGMAIAGIVTAAIGLIIFIVFIGISVTMPFEELIDEIADEF